ncbi:MAG: YhfC family glutamic-type intramembrane protease, partial [Anaerolineaceae bacterium]
SQVVHLPLNNWLADLGILPGTQAEMRSRVIAAALILGASAGVCEELARAAGYALLKKWRKDEHAVMLGLGHGGIESMVFGGVQTAAMVSSLWSLRAVDLTTLNLTPDQLSALQTQLNLFTGSAWAGFLPLLERLWAIAIHVLLSVMVARGFQKKNPLYVAGAIVYHMLADAVAVYGMYAWNNIPLTYAVLLVLLIPGAVWVFRTVRLPAEIQPEQRTGFGRELSAFWLAFRKELLQQWRSKRILVVGAVFLLFGMGSPLLAKYTPEIVSGMAGAEMFAGLIPEPGIGDAIGQYSKNLTQFGFMLAILLGMAAVAGEKERGTAALILTKPLPRWAFLVSKFAAQLVVYLLAFLVAGLGAYYYTVILFGAPDIGKFALINLILLMWLLTFVGVTLLGSVIGKSTGAAAGIGLALSVVLLLSGNIPNVGM